MGVISKFKNLIGLEDYEDELDEYEEEEYEQPVYRDRSAISSSSSSTTGSLSGNRRPHVSRHLFMGLEYIPASSEIYGGSTE